MKTLRGTPSSISTPVLGRAKVNLSAAPWARDSILVSDKPPSTWRGFAGFLGVGAPSVAGRIPSVTGIPESEAAAVKDGDIISLMPDGTVQVLWEAASRDNVLFTTDFCNSKCIMCPQVSDEPCHHYETAMRILDLAGKSQVEHIGITGGEPTLDANRLSELLTVCAKRFPQADVSLLTNGRRLSDFDLALCLSRAHRRMVTCIPLYADNDVQHDEIVGARGGFKETILGLHNLARLRQPVEIRVVLLRQNYRCLPNLAEFIYMNLPFACHVALMGMETSGFAAENLERVWVDPEDYRDSLEESVRILHQRAMNVSVYNLPHCLLPKSLWRFSRDSISTWKKTYLPTCGTCQAKGNCAGLFGTAARQSSNIVPITIAYD